MQRERLPFDQGSALSQVIRRDDRHLDAELRDRTGQLDNPKLATSPGRQNGERRDLEHSKGPGRVRPAPLSD
jgi:hypothetical protein